MKPQSARPELHNNYINGFFNNNINNEEQFDNTNNVLLNNRNEFPLNKKVVKIPPSNVKSKNNSVQLPNNIIVNDEDFNNVDKNEWIKNKLTITRNMIEKKIIYSLESEATTKNNKVNVLSAYKDNGLYVIYKYIYFDNNYGKEIKARIKWNMFSNHFKTYDKNNNVVEEIIYNFNFKGWNGPTKMQILIPFGNRSNIANIEKGKKNKLFVHKMENKLPEYNNIYKCYVLNFINRKVLPNERNIQIIYSDLKEDKNNILLQFAQIDSDTYILDYKYPFNNISAFSLALTLLSSRLFYQ